MRIVYDPEQKAHNPRHFLVRGQLKANPETPERVDILLRALQAAGHPVEAPADHGPAPRAAVHSPEYLQFLSSIAERWQSLPDAGGEVLPNVHPAARGGSYPRSAVGQAGYHMADTACPIAPETWRAACASANTAADAAARLLAGEGSSIYALCRPPGHHAFGDMAGGFCYLNNAAIAAQQLRQAASRVAILDVDVHHGNGTQGIFYARRDVLTLSVHADPADYYPFFWGHAAERGAGEGLGFNLNLPLPVGSGDADMAGAVGTALARIAAYAPGMLVIALGLDASRDDPLQGMTVSPAGFGQIGRMIGAVPVPTLIVQEGGYVSPSLGENLAAFLAGYEEGRA
ncbi:MAG: histone deacetylase family protein [Sneathiellaceae bacterium]